MLFAGVHETIRTSGLPLRRRLLYPLSYVDLNGFIVRYTGLFVNLDTVRGESKSRRQWPAG